MLQRISSYDAKTKIPEILKWVKTSKEVTITNRGKPITDIIPSRSGNELKTAVTISNRVIRHVAVTK